MECALTESEQDKKMIMEKENNGLIDNELLEIYGVAVRLVQVVKAFEVKLIEEQKGKTEVVLSDQEAINLVNHLGATASDATALLAKIAKERAEANGTPTIGFPLTRFGFN